MEVVLMNPMKRTAALILSLAVLIAVAGSVACQKKTETAAAEAAETVTEFEGTVNAALGRYMYLSSAQGFDIVLPGFDAAPLVGETIKVKGNLMADYPSLFLADSVERGGQTIYTRSQEFQLEDFTDMKAREAVAPLAISGINKPEEWEGKGEGKVYGELQKGDVNYIVLKDEKGRETAKIILDSISTYSNYYITKLRLFDKFWFYIKIKDTVDRKIRTRTKEIFHADVFDVGLF
jgi:hypothetical protein